MPIKTLHLPFFNFRDLNESVFSGSFKDIIAIHEPTLVFKPLHNWFFSIQLLTLKKLVMKFLILKMHMGFTNATF